MKISRNKKTGKHPAVKILKKYEIIRLKQVDHIKNEHNILGTVNHPFIVRKKHLIFNGISFVSKEKAKLKH